jgi:hypothetical protein
MNYQPQHNVNLPIGMTCGDCANFAHTCKPVYHHTEDDTRCNLWQICFHFGPGKRAAFFKRYEEKKSAEAPESTGGPTT